MVSDNPVQDFRSAGREHPHRARLAPSRQAIT
jgi:hypothetical protein